MTRRHDDRIRLPGAPNIPLGYLAGRLAEPPRDRLLAVNCQSGARSAIAAGLPKARGVANVANLLGGYAAWQAAGHPVERRAPAAVA